MFIMWCFKAHPIAQIWSSVAERGPVQLEAGKASIFVSRVILSNIHFVWFAGQNQQKPYHANTQNCHEIQILLLVS